MSKIPNVHNRFPGVADLQNALRRGPGGEGVGKKSSARFRGSALSEEQLSEPFAEGILPGRLMNKLIIGAYSYLN